MMRRLMHALAHLFQVNKRVPADYRNPYGQWVRCDRCLGCDKVYPHPEFSQ